MNKQLENKLTMYEGVWTLFGKNAEVVNSVPMLKSSVDEFGTTLAAIHLKSSEVSTATTGKAAMKYQAEDDLIVFLLPPCNQYLGFCQRGEDLPVEELIPQLTVE